MWARWFALSVFLPSQQLAKSRMRSTWEPRGQIGYFVVGVVRAVAHAGRHDEVVGVAVPVGVAPAVRDELALGRVTAGLRRVHVGPHGSDVDEVRRRRAALVLAVAVAALARAGLAG